MRSPVQRCSIAALCAVLGACASYPDQRDFSTPLGERQVLRGSDCLDPQFVRNWVDLRRGVMLVDSGRFKYRLELSGSCEVYGPTVYFRGSPVGGRVCGGGSDAVITRDHTCSITDMRLIDEEQYRELIEASGRHRRRAPARSD